MCMPLKICTWIFKPICINKLKKKHSSLKHFIYTLIIVLECFHVFAIDYINKCTYACKIELHNLIQDDDIILDRTRLPKLKNPCKHKKYFDWSDFRHVMILIFHISYINNRSMSSTVDCIIEKCRANQNIFLLSTF